MYNRIAYFRIFQRLIKTTIMIRKYYISIFILLLTGLWANAQITFGPSSNYIYLKGKDASVIAPNWMASDYNASTWASGISPFRFGTGSGGTLLSDMQNGYSTVYFRSPFTVMNLSKLKDVVFSVNFDDGFVLWINGEEVIRVYAPDSLTFDGLATKEHQSGTFVNYTLPAHDIPLKEGENLIAIQSFNSSKTNADFYFDFSIAAELPLPQTTDSVKVVFSQPNGFYTSPFDLQLTVPDQTYNILYTVDGSNPQTSPTVQNGGKSKTISINPASIAGRSKTPCFIVRASLKKDGFDATFPLTQTYIYLDQVITQTNPGGNWPAGSYVNNQIIDLEMDTKVTGDPKFSGLMRGALTDIPSISVVTDIENLFNEATGIYVNAAGHGENWERICSVELINPSGKPGFNINAGLRIRGGWSRHDNFPKHAFRLFFRQEYGASKLNFPLFEEEGVKEFDKIDLRCEQNYAWSQPPGDNKNRNTAVREVFSRDTQRDMGESYTRSRYYHLYLNGMYWGLYQTEERAEANYAADYFGGNKEDYDVVKVNTENWVYQVEATDGNLDSWEKIYNLCKTGFTTNAAYYALEGKDETGKPKKKGEVIINIDNLIDYMQVIFYTGNFDSPTSAFGGNSGPNNFFAIDRRDDKSSGFSFLTHDSEHTMMIEREGPGAGLYENRMQLNMWVTDLSRFHPGSLHTKLTANKEYRQRFADRAYRNFFNKGVFVPEVVHQRFQKRVDQIYKAIVAESARWGDFTTGANPPFTFDNWDKEIKDIYARFVPFRTQIVIDQLKAAKLYVNFNPPVFKKNNTVIDVSSCPVTGNYQIAVSADLGQIYYTLDGSDPRLVGGALNSTAKEIKTGNLLDLKGTASIKARVKIGEEWSALAALDLLEITEDYSKLKVTELHYHPTDSVTATEIVSGKSFEFIELKNTGDQPINLTGLKFTSGIDYQFKTSEVLPPKKFYVIASKPKWFYERHWMVPSGNFQNNFSNSGEQVILSNPAGTPVIDFQYFNTAPWATLPDGTGKSLTSGKINPTGNPNLYNYWAASSVYDGTPFADDLGVIDIVPEQPSTENSVALYPNPTKGVLYLKVKDPKSQVRIEIFTVSGNPIYESKFTGNAIIDLNRLNIQSGMYLLNTKYDEKNAVYKVIYRP